MNKVLIWGIGNDYENIINQIKFEELKGNIQIVGLISQPDMIWNSRRDGYPLLLKEKLVCVGGG